MSTDDLARSQIDENWSDPSSELFPDLPVKLRASSAPVTASSGAPPATGKKSVPPPPPSATRSAAPIAAALIGSAGPNRKRSIPPPPPRSRTVATLPSPTGALPLEVEIAQTSPGLGPLDFLVAPQALDTDASASDAVTVPLPSTAPGPYALPSLDGPPALDPADLPASRAVADSSERVKVDEDTSPESGARKLEVPDDGLDDFGPEDFNDVKPRVVAEAAISEKADDENLATRVMAAAPLLDADPDADDLTNVQMSSTIKSDRPHSLPPLVAPRKPLAPPAPRASAPPFSGSLSATSKSLLPPPSLPPLPLPSLPKTASLPPTSMPPSPARFAMSSLPGSSIAPVALARGVALARSIVPALRQNPRLAVLSAAALGGVALLVTLLVLVSGSDTNAARGSLVVTVAGAGAAPVEYLAVYADDAVSCRASPCKIAELEPGTHFVRIRAPGYQETAARAVSVQKGSEAVVHVQLTPLAKEPRADDEAKVATGAVMDLDDTRGTAPSDLRMERSTRSRAAGQSGRASTSTKTSAPVAEAPPAKAEKSGKPGTLNISSNPPSNVVLDGRPLGTTPRLGVRVPAGVHSVVFVHPQFGRKVQSATVAAGAARSVAVRFR